MILHLLKVKYDQALAEEIIKTDTPLHLWTWSLPEDHLCNVSTINPPKSLPGGMFKHAK